MKIRIYVFYAFVILLIISGFASANVRESQYVREESARRNMKLITEERAKEIAKEYMRSTLVTFREIELDDEADDYPNRTGFRPVYELDCVSGYEKYDLVIDAVTGEILKFKPDN